MECCQWPENKYNKMCNNMINNIQCHDYVFLFSWQDNMKQMPTQKACWQTNTTLFAKPAQVPFGSCHAEKECELLTATFAIPSPPAGSTLPFFPSTST